MLSKLLSRFGTMNLTVNISGEETVKETLRRNTELLADNNNKLQRIRDLKAALRAYQGIADEMEDLLIEHSEATGYCGCDLERRHHQAFAAAAKELV